MRFITRIRKFMQAQRDHKLNREYVGRDKFGNKYYQYYSYLGLPTKREIQYVEEDRTKPFKDTAFFWWMNKTDNIPPNESDLKLYYNNERERKAKAISWDKKQKELDRAFYAQRNEIDEKWSKPEDFRIEEWNPKNPNKKKGWKELEENFKNEN